MGTKIVLDTDPGHDDAIALLLALAPFEQRYDHARGEGVAGGGAVDCVHLGRCSARHFLPVLEQDRALGTQGERGQARSLGQRVELVTVDDDEVGATEHLDRHGLRGGRVEREEAGCRSR